MLFDCCMTTARVSRLSAAKHDDGWDGVGRGSALPMPQQRRSSRALAAAGIQEEEPEEEEVAPQVDEGVMQEGVDACLGTPMFMGDVLCLYKSFLLILALARSPMMFGMRLQATRRPTRSRMSKSRATTASILDGNEGLHEDTPPTVDTTDTRRSRRTRG